MISTPCAFSLSTTAYAPVLAAISTGLFTRVSYLPGARLVRSAHVGAACPRDRLCSAPENSSMRTLFLVVILLALVGCQREGPAEKAGRSIDKAGENLRDAVKGKK